MTIIPLCLSCQHLHPGRPATGPLSCKAFPGGIPAKILIAEADHRKPFPGDRGIRYLPESGAEKGEGDTWP